MINSKQRQFKDLDFEISFYEGVLQERPNFIPALIALGDAYTRRGYFHKGLTIDKRLVKLKPKDATARYNLACSYSLLGKINQALDALKAAVELGYTDFEYMDKDPDLDNLRKHPAYKQIVSISQKNDFKKNSV